MFNPDPAAYLPHRHPFLLLDRITELERGIRAVAQLTITSGQGFPQVLMIECLAQLSGILTISEENDGGFLAAIERADFSGAAQAGDLLTISTRMISSFGRLFLVDGEVNCCGTTLLSARMTLGVGKL
ncbi:MAG TPA: hydroxymyristoyl-ACP dehydratase [Desulfuromonadales bacterium]|nr:hydroxymyristoyl-ACP dehydratase [Desulfuromonadales bacterium]